MTQIYNEPQPASLWVSNWLRELPDRIDRYQARSRLFEIIKANDNRRWQAIKDLYKTIDVTKFEPYPIDWTVIFSPIESMAWGEIRYMSLPFWPQYPIGKYFADFANPIKKIVIECDGRAFHSAASDRQRDHDMAADGWRVYRISGADCNRIVKSPWEEISDRCLSRDDIEAERIISNWMHNTVDGLIASIAYVHFAKPFDTSKFFRSEAGHVLSRRQARGM